MAAIKLRLGTRASALAQWQANWVADRLRECGAEVELVLITTRGDDTGLAAIGGNSQTTGVFTKDLQLALLDGRIDLAVHSLKDLPTDEVSGLTLAAVPERASPFDALVAREGATLDELPRRARVGTGSWRRRAMLLNRRSDLVMCDVRGNVDTRLSKLREGQYDALVLAEAGLTRLGFEASIAQVLPADFMLPAIGQGALGVETRSDDVETLAVLQQLNHPATRQAVLAERSLLAELRGGCLAPVGAWGRLIGDARLHLDAAVLSRDGASRLDARSDAAAGKAVDLGRRVARELIDAGAEELIAASRESS